MTGLLYQVKDLARGYVRKGGKDNRRQQAARMIAFAAHCEAMGAREISQVGGSHVISYWKASRGLSDATRYNHWLAMRALWRLAGKLGDPPRPLPKKIVVHNPNIDTLRIEDRKNSVDF